MTTLRTLLVMSLASAWFARSAGAAAYYVAAEDPRASDDNKGSEAAPFKTIVRSLTGLQAGDTVLVKRGTYREHVILSPVARNGCPAVTGGRSYAQMLSFQAYPGDEVVIKGSDVVTGWKPYKDAIYVTDACPAPGIYVLLFCDGKRLQLIGDGGGNMMKWISGWGGGNAWKKMKGTSLDDLEAGSYFYDRATKKLYAWLPDGSDPGKHLMEAAVRGGFNVQVDYVRVSGFRILHADASLDGDYGIMEDCESSDSAWNGFGIQGQYNTIMRCKFNRCGNTGICGRGRGHRFIQCETSGNNFLKMSPSWHAGGVKIISLTQGIVFDGHLAAHNEGDGIWFDSGNFDTIIANCVTHHNTGSGIFYEIGERAAILNNVCYENSGRGVYLSNSSDCQVLNNVFWHNGMSGVACIGINRGYTIGVDDKQRLPAANNIVWGNLFVDNCHPDFCPKDLDGRNEPWDTRAELIMPEEWEGNTGNVSDYNIYYRSPKRALPFWKGWHQTLYADLAAWQKQAGCDRHSIVAEPLFMDTATFNFRPAKGSPAVNFVQPRMGSVYDMTGKLRPTEERKDNQPLRFTAGPFELRD